jgi:uncharacterized Zn finger protein
MTLDPDRVLERCPECGAWPMSMAAKKTISENWGHLVFRCSQCARVKTLQLTSGGISPKRTEPA